MRSDKKFVNVFGEGTRVSRPQRAVGDHTCPQPCTRPTQSLSQPKADLPLHSQTISARAYQLKTLPQIRSQTRARAVTRSPQKTVLEKRVGLQRETKSLETCLQKTQQAGRSATTKIWCDLPPAKLFRVDPQTRKAGRSATMNLQRYLFGRLRATLSHPSAWGP